jgi:hypothetical protein
MTTRLGLRELCRRRLADTIDTVFWSDEKINQWINDAIADYSNYFPYEQIYQVTLTAGTHEYSLSSLVRPRSILAVEYPINQDPLEYLTFRDIHDQRGFFEGDYYFVIGVPPTAIILGPGSWATGAKAELTYLSDHSYPDDDADVITVPDLHLELITLFVVACAMQDVESRASQNPSSTSWYIGNVAANVSKAMSEYRNKVEEYRKTWQLGSQVKGWGYEGEGRIY